MSRFETSKFVRDSSVMRESCLIEACDKLGWSYHKEGDALLITDIKAGCSFGYEYAIKVEGDKVTYNTYYLGNTREYVDKLQSLYSELNAEYSKSTVIGAFKNHGFTYREDDYFQPDERIKYRFYMVGRSNDPEEKDPVGRIKFTIYADGTVVSDSNYLPEDVNVRAHASMDDIDSDFSSKRVMTKKDIPVEYKDRINKSKARYQQMIKK